MKIKTKIGAVTLMVMFGLFAAAVAYGSEFRRSTLQVEQMRCGSCLRVIDAELRKVPGIAGMTAKFTERQVVVDHESGVKAQDIAAIITGLGYPTQLVASLEIAAEQVNRFQRAGFGGGAGCGNPGGASPVAESWKELRRRVFRNGKRGPADGSQP